MRICTRYIHVMHTVKNKSRNKCHLFETQPLIDHICMYIYLLDQQNVYLIGILEQTEAPKCTCVPTLNAVILKKSFLLSQRLFLWEALIRRNKECIEWKQRNRKLHGHIFLIAWLSFVYKNNIIWYYASVGSIQLKVHEISNIQMTCPF